MSISDFHKFINNLIKERDDFYVIECTKSDCRLRIMNNEHFDIAISKYDKYMVSVDIKGKLFSSETFITIGTKTPDESVVKKWLKNVIEHFNKLLLAGEI